MKRLITPTVQISIALLSLTISILLVAYSLGLFPSDDSGALETRARISESLAIELANLVGRKDAVAIKDIIDAEVERDSEILSMGIRGVDGKLLVGSGDHESRWVELTDGKSTATEVQISLRNGDVPAGRIELVFRPLASSATILGLPPTLFRLLGFTALAGFLGYCFILKRALRELDPGRAIPERVKTAFDTLAEGVVIIDEREFVLLSNDAFAKNIAKSSDSLLGTSISALPWAHSDTVTSEMPWRTAMRSEHSVLGVPLEIYNRDGDARRLLVNATRILDGGGIARGVIATFNDVTDLHQKNEQLNLSIQQLQISQAKISEQNEQLQFLASSDPLTACLNRRTFFERAERALYDARIQHQPMSFLMVDADHFKSINDRFGHVTGDKVLVGLADLLKRACSGLGLVGRYGGEEFCIAVTGLFATDVERLAEQIRRAVADVTTWLPNGERVTISIGIASLDQTALEIADLVKRADEALYAAKTGGRNRFVSWEAMRPRVEATGPRKLTDILNRA